MNAECPENEDSEDTAMSLREGRIAYIGDMAAELAGMARSAGEVGLARMLDRAASEARRIAEKYPTFPKISILE